MLDFHVLRNDDIGFILDGLLLYPRGNANDIQKREQTRLVNGCS